MLRVINFYNSNYRLSHMNIGSMVTSPKDLMNLLTKVLGNSEQTDGMS